SEFVLPASIFIEVSSSRSFCRSASQRSDPGHTYPLRAIRGARPAHDWSQSVVDLCIEKVFPKHKTGEEGRKIHLSKRFFVNFRRWRAPSVGRSPQVNRGFANAHSRSGAVRGRIPDLERPSPDEE